MSIEKSCEVISFYSYTGGAGRSMALANVACLLARRCPQDRGVLMVDSNLAAPSLHRFFADKFQNLTGDALSQHPGLLDLFLELEAKNSKSKVTANSLDAAFQAVDPGRFVIPTDIPALSLLKAGRFDGDYFGAASGFQWAALHERAPQLIESLLNVWRQHYRFVLIDSPSGVTDLSGLCTMLLPDKLVVAFTPSRQSLDGAIDVARCAADFRRDAGSRPLSIFPMPSKIETADPELRSDWRYSGRQGEPKGYETCFADLFAELDKGDHGALGVYFSDVQIPYVPRYAYGDEVAAAKARAGDCPLTRAYGNLMERLRQTARPWDAFDPEADESIIEVSGRTMDLAAAEEHCLRQVDAGDHPLAVEALEILGAIRERQGKVQEAEAHYLDAMTRCRAQQDTAGQAAAVSRLARLHRATGRIEEARAYYLNAVALYREGRWNAALASTLATLGDLDARLGETAAAREHYEEAIERYRNESDNAGVANALMRLAGVEKRLGSEESALVYYQDAARLYYGERDNAGLAGALESLAESQQRAGSPEKAEENYFQAAQIYRGERDNLRLAFALRSLADVRRNLKKVDEAIAHYQEAIELFRGEKENLGLATALQSLADVESRSGRHASAHLHYSEAAVLYRTEGNNLGVANTLHRLGDLERRMGRLDASRSNYEQGMELYRAEGHSIGLANSLQSLGDLEKRLGKIPEAEQRYTQAIQIYRGEGANLGLGNSLKSLGDVESESGNLRVARDHYEQAIELYRAAGGRTLGVANTLQSLGDLDRRQKHFKEAVAHYSTACDLYRREKNMTGLAYTLSELARVSHALFDFTASIGYLSEAAQAARQSNAPSVIEYVKDVQREIHSAAAGIGA